MSGLTCQNPGKEKASTYGPGSSRTTSGPTAAPQRCACGFRSPSPRPESKELTAADLSGTASLAVQHANAGCRTRQAAGQRCQCGVKSWLVPAAFLHCHWSSCWPRLLPPPCTSRHNPLFWFLNSYDPSDCGTGSHKALAAPLGGCWMMSGVPAAVELLATATSSPEFCACS